MPWEVLMPDILFKIGNTDLTPWVKKDSFKASFPIMDRRQLD